MPIKRDLAQPIWRGDDFYFPLDFRVDGVPQTLLGKTLDFMLKCRPSDPDDEAILHYSLTFSVSDTEVDNGRHLIHLLPSQTQQLFHGCPYYQIVLTTPDTPENTVTTYAWGKAPVKDS